MKRDRNYTCMIIAAVAAGLVGGLAVRFFKTLPLNKHLSQSQDRDHIVLGGIAKGIIKIPADSGNHPYINMLGQAIRLFNQENVCSHTTKLLSKKSAISS